jgi:hypothetical protein
MKMPSSRKVAISTPTSGHKEFFAELAEAYFGENDYPPFTRQELQTFDLESYEVIAAAWARP